MYYPSCTVCTTLYVQYVLPSCTVCTTLHVQHVLPFMHSRYYPSCTVRTTPWLDCLQGLSRYRQYCLIDNSAVPSLSHEPSAHIYETIINNQAKVSVYLQQPYQKYDSYYISRMVNTLTDTHTHTLTHSHTPTHLRSEGIEVSLEDEYLACTQNAHLVMGTSCQLHLLVDSKLHVSSAERPGRQDAERSCTGDFGLCYGLHIDASSPYLKLEMNVFTHQSNWMGNKKREKNNI